MRNISKTKGFTLVEALAALMIFSLAVLAVLAVLSTNIQSTENAKKKTIAAYLAQEGIEYMRNLRDTFVLYEAPGEVGWDEFLIKISDCDSSASPRGCYFDPSTINFGDDSQPIRDMQFYICGSSCEQLTYDDVTGVYGYDITDDPSAYTRQIKTRMISLDELEVISTVYWEQGSGEYEVTFSESLFNWTK
jgi:type IV pilus modification protein PilV